MRAGCWQGATMETYPHGHVADICSGDASLAFEGVVGVGERGLVEAEEVAQVVGGEVALDVFLLVDHTAAESLLVGLALENLLLNCPRRDHAVDEAPLLLPVPPHARHRLQIRRWVPIRIVQHQPAPQNHAQVSKLPGQQSGTPCRHGYLLAPMRLRPHPPAFELSRKRKAGDLGSLN